MQLETPLQVVESETTRHFTISREAVAYIAILVLALLLRLAEIDTTPLMSSETHNALAAWRVIMVNAPGVPLVSSSSIVFTLQSITFTLFGGSEFSARLATVIGGVLLILTPALFRPLLGRSRAFFLSLLLAFSPVLLIASRSSSPDVWGLLFALLGLWALWQVSRTGQARYAWSALVLFAALIFLVGAGGIALALILGVAALLTALWRSRNSRLADEDELKELTFEPMRRSLGLALPFALLVVLAVGTGFMLYPAGLSAVSESIGGALRAVIQPQGMHGYAALIALFYEPALWVLAIVGLIVRRERLATLDIFLTAWVVLGIVVSLFFADGVPDHALWLTVPLAILTANTLVSIFVLDDGIAYTAAPRWGRVLIAVCTIGIFAVFTIALQSTARSMVQSAQPILSMVTPQPDSIILLLVSVMFLVIGYFLFSSLWGNRSSWQGIGLGIAIFGALTSLGSGWGAAVPNAQNPIEFWHMSATNSNTRLLRSTLYDVADRISGGFPGMPVFVVAPQDGEVAWLLRDFQHTQFISSAADAQNAEVVLLPKSTESPQLGAAYVGEDFTIRRTWDLSTVNWIDFPAWWTQQQARTPWTGEDVIVLWLRQDVYNGLNQSIQHTN